MMALKFFLATLATAQRRREPKVALLLMVRDEEPNLRENLWKWRSIYDVVVCGVDERTTDGSAKAVLDEAKEKWGFSFRFEDFGQGRSIVLKEAYRKTNATHVLFIDPDWDPKVETLRKSEIDFTHRSFAFLVYDRNGLTTRNVAWLARHDEGLYFKHRLHEVLVLPETEPPKMLTWQIYEREVPGRRTWHTEANKNATSQGHSHSYERYLKDLRLLELDLKDHEEDPHTLYYLGATHFAALEAMLGVGEHLVTSATEHHVASGIAYFQRRIQVAQPRDFFDEHTWAAMRWLAHGYHYYRRDEVQASQWYERCHKYDPSRVDCLTFLAALHRRAGRAKQAWTSLLPGLRTTFDTTHRHFGHNFYIYNCSLPVEGALALADGALDDFADGLERQLLLHFGANILLNRADENCYDSRRKFISARPEEVDQARLKYNLLLSQENLPSSWTTTCVPRGISDLLPMMSLWGLVVCP